jgi:glycosyltransferase involved in cell wall biosynthesis
MTNSGLIYYVDPYRGGHHSDYLAFFEKVCAQRNLRLRAFVPRAVWEAAHHDGAAAELAEDVDLGSAGVAGYWHFLARLEAAARRDRPSLIFFAQFHSVVPALALRNLLLMRLSAPWTGLYWRDSFNYPGDEKHSLLRQAKTTVRAIMLRLAMRRSGFPLVVLNERWRLSLPSNVFFLPAAMTELDMMARTASLSAGQWPLPQEPEKTDGRTRFLIFGALEPRKGIIEFCDALLLLDAAALQKISLRLMGVVVPRPGYREQLLERLEQLREKGIAVEFKEGFVPSSEIEAGLRWCDVSVATYIDHLSVSGVLSAAVQCGRPSIAQASYQIGELVREYGLGWAVNSRSPAEIADAVRQALAGEVVVGKGMADYRDHYSPEKAFEAALDFFSKAKREPSKS